MKIQEFTNKRTEILNSLRKTIKGSQAYELHFNNLRILHVEVGSEVLKQAGKM